VAKGEAKQSRNLGAMPHPAPLRIATGTSQLIFVSGPPYLFR